MEEIVDPNIMQYSFAIIRIFKMLSMQVKPVKLLHS